MASHVPGPYWKSLLAVATSATEQDAKNEHSEPRVLDDENRKWLEQVMSDLVKDTDPSIQLEKIMKSLHCYAANSNDIKEDDMDKLKNLADRLDELLSFAFLTQQFVNTGGLVMIRQFLEKHSETIQCSFAQILLTFTENNPPAQHAVITSGLLEYILNFLANETTTQNEKLKYKYLGAVSGTVRSDELAFREFFEQYVPKERVPVDLKSILIEALKKEYHYKDEVQINNLLKRYE